MTERFRSFASATAGAMGSPWAFLLALAACIVWAVSGPFFRFSEDWQLVINTGTTIATFLVVFLIQNTQNRDAKAIHLKLDELIRAVGDARTGLVDLEHLPDKELAQLEAEFKRIHERTAGEAKQDTAEAVEAIEDEQERRELPKAA